MITDNTQVTIQIPATIDRDISPNGRAHWRVKHRLQQELKNTTIWAVKQHYLDLFPCAPWRLDYTVAWGRNRKRMDDDNIKSALKYVQDGIAAEMSLDDRYIEVGRVKQIRDPLGVGYIEVTISSVEEGIPA